MVRVRFAPSPTGGLHIGGVRTALYNYLLAKKTGGTFIIRIEDTDQNRFVEGAENYIMEALKWVGIIPDESPLVGGPFAPYRQSERKSMYMQYAMELLEKGQAYYAFDTAEELDAMRKQLEAAKVPNPQYNAVTRETMKNSLTLPAEEVKKLLDANTPYVIRLKVPRKEEIRFQDQIRGWIMVHSSAVDDKILMKSDGMPTYHLANIVDDHLMEITHVIRGEEWLPSAPLHILLYQAFGWEPPKFAHLPLLLKPDGNGKLSKRDGEAHGFPVFPLAWEKNKSFKEEGYLPEAVVNFLALLGWNPGTTQELFTMDELIQAFSIERVGKSGTKFDINKAKWFNQQYIRKKTDAEILQYIATELKKNQVNTDFSQEKILQICHLVKERVVFPKDFYEESKFFFTAPTAYENEIIQKKWTAEAVDIIQSYIKCLNEKQDNFTAELAKQLLEKILEEKNSKLGKVMPALRVALTGVGAGPDLMHMMEILGQEEVSKRLQNAVRELESSIISSN